MTTVTAYEAKTHLPRLLRAAERGETVIITRHGKPVAQLGPVQDRRREEIAQVIERMKRARAQRPEGLSRRNPRVEARGPQVLMSVVLDSSIVGCWCFPDETSPVADAAMLEVAADEAVVPALWWFEVRNLADHWRAPWVGWIRSEAQVSLPISRCLSIRIDRAPESEVVLALAQNAPADHL